MPFGEKQDADGETIDFDAIYADIIKPAIEGDAMRRVGGPPIDCVRCDEIERSGWIMRTMIEAIHSSEVAVVDLSTLNPNVFYELGVRHAVARHVTVLIARAGTSTPFNLGGLNCIRYDSATPEGRAAAQTAIARYVANGLRARGTDSLVHEVLNVHTGPRTLPGGGPIRYRVPGLSDPRRLALLTGDLQTVRQPIELWVNSENTQMQMARPYDRASSAVIRYLGAERNVAGQVTKDLIADELAGLMDGVASVPPGTVLVTGSGRLIERGVKHVLHVAAVQGSIGGGWKPVDDIRGCIDNVLSEADALRIDGAAPRSILLPLLGTGSGRAELDAAINMLFDAVLGWLARYPTTALETVYLQVFDEKQMQSCRRTLARLGAETVV